MNTRFLAVLLASLFIGTTSASAQSETNTSKTNGASAPKSKSRMETMQVTGSYIKRTDVEGPSPVVIIDRAQIEATGFDNVGEVLRTSTVSPFGGSGAGVNLRGIGSSRTLILVNGHRAPKSGDSYDFGPANVNLVPLAAVDRIEVLKDGATATYGADALGGVVNIITRSDFDGLSFATKHNMTGPIGGDSNRTSAAYGWNTSDSSLLTSLQVQYFQGSLSSAIPATKDTPTSPVFSPNYASGGALTAGPNCTETDGTVCRENIRPFIGSNDGFNIGNMTHWTKDFSSDTQAYATFLGTYGQSKSFTVGSPFGTPGIGSGISFDGTEPAAVNWGNQLGGYTTGNPISIYGRLDKERITNTIGSSLGLILGLKGYLGESDWNWDVSLNNQVSLFHERSGDQGLFAPTRAAIASGQIDAFGPGADPGGLTADSVVDNRYQVNWLNMVVAGPIPLNTKRLGDWSGALGASAAHFEYKDNRDDRVLSNQFMGLSGIEGGGERQLYAAFAELVGQFGPSFETQLSVRSDVYSDFGNPINPKLAFRYQPTNGLMFRASGSTGFKAPELQEAYGGDRLGFFNGIVDSLACANDGEGSPSCDPNSFSAAAASNPDLKEETSVNYNFGMVVEPSKNFNFSFDYWYVKVDGTIGLPPVQKILDLQRDGVDITQYANLTRDSTGALTRIEVLLSNIGTEEADGLDFNASYRFPTKFGDFTLLTEHTYMFNYYQTFFEGLGKEQVLGQPGLPRWRNNTTLQYSKDQLTAQFVARTSGRVQDFRRTGDFIEAYTQYDMTIDFALKKNAVFQVGALNLFDQQPRWDEGRSGRVDTTLYRRFRTAFVAYRQTF